MHKEELYEELKMSYYELQSYLLNKYGSAKYDYFATSECRSKNKKISRTAEGLYCHHMDEDKGGNLASPDAARKQPFEWQKKERLVYCNIIEHLLLHIKIAILRQKKMLNKPLDVHDFFTTGGIFQLCAEINELFVKGESNSGWRSACYERIKENYEDYILLLQTVSTYIDKCYIAEKKNGFLRVGSFVHFFDCDCEIIKIARRKDRLLLKMPSGEERVFSASCALSQYEYEDCIDIVKSKMASLYDGFCDQVYNDLQRCQDSETVTQWAECLKVDFRGYGFSQFSNVKLSAEFGAENADEYISNAFPLYRDQGHDLVKLSPRFWKGAEVPTQAKDKFYIIRIETAFSLKDGFQPFVYYKKRDLLRKDTLKLETNDENNFLHRNGIILSTSDVYDDRTNKYWSKYRDRGGKIVDATVVLTLAREDYEMFKKYYHVSYLKILDGCYFNETGQ